MISISGPWIIGLCIVVMFRGEFSTILHPKPVASPHDPAASPGALRGPSTMIARARAGGGSAHGSGPGGCGFGRGGGLCVVGLAARW